VVDFTANWAGPIITHVLGMFGATVIKIESAARPDALRFNTVKALDEDQYWEWSPIFHGTNTSKRDLTLDMSTARGRELARNLVRTADVVVENSSPRVMDSWGLTAAVVSELNPACVYLRAPAYGLEGPWRDRVGYAQTIEMISGLAWLTGYRDELPVIPNSPCDPVAGLHALGQPGWAGADLATGAQRRAAHDEIDARLTAWCASRSADEVVEALWPAGVPVGKVMLGYEQGDVEQIRARGWFQTLHHRVAGRTVQSGFPALFSAGPRPEDLHTSPAPCLGHDNHEILSALLGCTEDEIAELQADGVIGTRPGGSTAW
jgi:crotonobetainyl-CoA:carnitine CoA-transferase CaiB-like acyl-CoA transferase